MELLDPLECLVSLLCIEVLFLHFANSYIKIDDSHRVKQSCDRRRSDTCLRQPAVERENSRLGSETEKTEEQLLHHGAVLLPEGCQRDGA